MGVAENLLRRTNVALADASVTTPRKVDLRDIEDLQELLRGPR